MIPRRIIVIIIPEESVMYDLLNADLTHAVNWPAAGWKGKLNISSSLPNR